MSILGEDVVCPIRKSDNRPNRTEKVHLEEFYIEWTMNIFHIRNNISIIKTIKTYCTLLDCISIIMVVNKIF